MTSGQHEVMFRVEDRLWWYVGMQAITRAVVERTYVRGGDLRILDAGCGTGASMAYLSDSGAPSGLISRPMRWPCVDVEASAWWPRAR